MWYLPGLFSCAMLRRMSDDVVPLWLEEEFDGLNARFFDGQLPRLHFMVNRWAGQPAGYFAIKTGAVFFHPGTIEQGREFVADSLLHELVHHALRLGTGDADGDHGVRFVAMANRIGARLGLPLVDPGTDAAEWWPQSVRPEGYHTPKEGRWVLKADPKVADRRR